MGGALVGFVDNVEPARLPSGQPIAVLDLKLDKSLGKLPVDSTFTIALKGAIGQKYLAIGLGHSTRTFASGATVPLRQTSATVDLDQVLDMFSPPTRAGVVASTIGFSDGLAGRGVDVNDADRSVRAAAHRPSAGGAQPGLVPHESRRLPARAREPHRRTRPGRERAGPTVRRSRRDLPRAGERVGPLAPAIHLRHAAGLGRGDRRTVRSPGRS